MGAWDFDFECGTCGKAFPAGWQARDKHCNALGHHPPAFECYTCPRILRSERARYQHALDLNHFENECSLCDETYPTPEEQTAHEHEDHLYCRDCKRYFQSYHNLKQVSIWRVAWALRARVRCGRTRSRLGVKNGASESVCDATHDEAGITRLDSVCPIVRCLCGVIGCELGKQLDLPEPPLSQP